MAKTALDSASYPDGAQLGAQPSVPESMAEMGEAGGKDSLARLNSAVGELRAVAAAPVLRRAIDFLNREDFVNGGKWAVKALEIDERNGVGWYLLAIARERAGDFGNSVRAYEAALALLPEHAEVANDLGRLAFRMGMHEQAEKLFRHYIDHAPERADGVNNLASVMREQGRTEETIELLRAAIQRHPESAMLWNTLGSVVMDQGDLHNAATFFGEAVRLNPKFGKARYNLSQVKHGLGDNEGAMADCDAALRRTNTAEDKQMMGLARATYQLCLGRIGSGWDDYEARLSAQFAGVTHFAIERPRWKPGGDLRGKRFLVCTEQGLGDEVMFANVLPDVLEQLGPDGKLILAVERRLVTLFQRSFPTAEVSRHITNVVAASVVRRVPEIDQSQVDLWTPIASLMRQYRRRLEAFPQHQGYLRPDPERIAHWREVLKTAPAGPKVGLLWKSNISKGRTRFFSPFDQWRRVLATPGASFVNLQYGDCSEELERAKREFGVTIWQPPGIDLKEDLDDVAALCCAMDVTIGFSNATLNIGAACGAPAWLLTTPGIWTRLGSDAYPWYPHVRTFAPPAFGEWDALMEDVAGALSEFVAERT
ncbi:MAG: tetratricopeptide repeat protein [Phenylobacterium sp.]|uniref:tetratricopeptide repeat protein n=1 Tax=Phenylobacterium sp. TaxID=1871053 RepID=UPI001A49156A|nr:tetratricopeptide repeat protein [Phenylobacterium sp.]MBL8771316.1 tetratricopeptide repeat protein [Phenylobacterium sp.]